MEKIKFVEEPLFIIGGRNTWIIARDVVVDLEHLELTIPVGFETNFASIPRLFRIFIPINGKHRVASLIHDYLYASHMLTRKEADMVFRDIMQSFNVKPWRVWVMHKAVRMFGWLAW